MNNNNNYGNGNQNPNGYPSNNNNWNNPGYGNNFNPNYGYNNYNQNWGDGTLVAKTCKNLAIAYLCLILLMIVAAILAGVFAGMTVSSVYDSYSYYSYDSSSVVDYSSVSMAMVAITIIALISFEIIAIVLIVKTNALKNYYPDTGAIWILFLIGLFIGITGIVGSCMTISACNRAARQSKNSYDTPQSEPTRY